MSRSARVVTLRPHTTNLAVRARSPLHHGSPLARIIQYAITAFRNLRICGIAQLCALRPVGHTFRERVLHDANVALEQLVLRSVVRTQVAADSCKELGLPPCCRLPLLEEQSRKSLVLRSQSVVLDSMQAQVSSFRSFVVSYRDDSPLPAALSAQRRVSPVRNLPASVAPPAPSCASRARQS